MSQKKITELPIAEDIFDVDGNEIMFPAAFTTGTDVTKKVSIAEVGGWVKTAYKLPVASFRTTIAQATTGAPTGAAFGSNISGTATFGRIGGGEYTLTFSEAWMTAGRTDIRINNGWDTLANTSVKAGWDSTTVVIIKSELAGVLADDVISGGTLTIDVYSA
jgi:hypothetical protein